MKYSKSYWSLMAFCSSLVLSLAISPGMAKEEQPAITGIAGTETATHDQKEPETFFETEGDFFLGYRWVSTEDSLKAAEYIYPHSSASFGLNLSGIMSILSLSASMIITWMAVLPTRIWSCSGTF
jgi:hypothetical protein